MTMNLFIYQQVQECQRCKKNVTFNKIRKKRQLNINQANYWILSIAKKNQELNKILEVLQYKYNINKSFRRFLKNITSNNIKN